MRPFAHEPSRTKSKGNGAKVGLYRKCAADSGLKQTGRVFNLLSIIDNLVNGEYYLPPGDKEDLFALVREAAAGHTIIGTTYAYNKNQLTERHNLVRDELHNYQYDARRNMTMDLGFARAATPPTKKVKLVPGTPEHKQARFQDYLQPKGADALPYDRWSPKYDTIIGNNKRGYGREREYRDKLGMTNRVVRIDDRRRQIDLFDEPTRYAGPGSILNCTMARSFEYLGRRDDAGG